MIKLAEDDGLGGVPPFSSSVNWIGCGECDVSFPCNNGQAKCLRLNNPVQSVAETKFTHVKEEGTGI